MHETSGNDETVSTQTPSDGFQSLLIFTAVHDCGPPDSCRGMVVKLKTS